MARDLNQFDFYSLWSGGDDGGIIRDASSALTGAEVHMIEILADATIFTVLEAQDQADATVNMLTANNYTAKEFSKGQLIGAPFGGHITKITADKDVRYFKFPGTNRVLNEA